MAKPANDIYAKRPDESHLEWQMRRARMKADSRDKDAPLVTPEAKRHGDYKRDFVTHVDTNTKADTYINRGGTPVCRWANAKKLSDTQLTAIALCDRLWSLAGLRQRVTANYGERIAGAGDVEARATNEIEAREDLARIKGYFPGPLKAYWSVFENVCRYQIPAGVAGAADGYDSKAATARALTIVCFVADYIATEERL